MKSPVQRLSGDERALLAHFYGSETYEALQKLIEQERLDLAKDHVNQVEILNVRYLSGQVVGLKKLIETIKQLHKDIDKES